MEAALEVRKQKISRNRKDVMVKTRQGETTSAELKGLANNQKVRYALLQNGYKLRNAKQTEA